MPSNVRASRISETFSKLDTQIRTFTRNITSAESVARKFDSALKLDPTNLKVANEKFNNLSVALKNAQDRLDASRAQLEELNRVFADNKDSARYQDQLRKTTTETKKFEAEVERLNVLVNDARKSLTSAAPSVKSFKERLAEGAAKADLFGKSIKTAKTLILGMIAGVVKLTKEMAELGKELTSNAAKYDTTVSKLQEQSYLFYTLTGNADAYTSSLQAMNSVMAQILSGRGQSQLQSLAQIGLRRNDLVGKSTAEAYETVFNALRNVEDQATATAVAVKLFGDSGAYVAKLAQASDEDFNRYVENFRRVGGISEESAEKLAQLSDDMYLLRYSLKASGAEIITNFAPAINGVLVILVNLSKAIGALYERLGPVPATIITLSTLLTAKMIPSIIKLIVQTKLETAATWAQVAAKTALIGAMTFGVGAVIGLASAIGASAATSKLAASSMDSYADSIGKAADAARDYEKVTSRMNTNMSVVSENIERTNSTYSSDVTFTIKAEGDTPISQENAKQISEITVEQINKALGGIVS